MNLTPDSFPASSAANFGNPLFGNLLFSNPLAGVFADQCWRWAAGTPTAVRQALAQAARALVNATLAGHSCLTADERPEGADDATLLASGVVGRSGEKGGGALPIMLDAAGRLYLARHDAAEQLLADALGDRAKPGPHHGQLHIFCGGPGTGKTTRVCALLAERLTSNPDLRIALAAPTGKAAARLMESLAAQSASLPEAIRTRLPQEATTLHRLLGIVPGRAHPAFHREQPLPLDLLIVDEASMLDLALAARLLNALPGSADLVLLGDPDQLAAVESGAVFAEISQPGAQPLAACITRLTVSHRFAGDSALGQLAAAIRDQQVQTALDCLEQGGDILRLLPDDNPALTPGNRQQLLAGYADYFTALEQHRDADLPSRAAAAFAAFNRFRILSPLRAGGRGVAALNALLDQHGANHAQRRQGAWYVGRPLLILKNDPASRLFNGDIGLVLNDGERLLAVFADGQNFRSLALARLPEHDSAWALTVHKAQGSEWENLALVLPDEDSKILSRELAYTAITRARQRVTIIGNSTLLQAAIGRPNQRYSGLAERIRKTTI